MPDISLRIHREILLRLPVMSQFRFRAVSKPVAARNDLILIAPECLAVYRDSEANCDAEGTWEISNPLTREPQVDFNSHVLGIGLGYDCATDDYKVVVIDYEYDKLNDKSLSQHHVYSLKSNCPFNVLSRKSSFGVFLKGALHWVSDDDVIVFDVCTENYCPLTLPPIQMKPESTRLSPLDYMNDYGSQDFSIKLFDLRGYDVYYSYFDLCLLDYMKKKNGVLHYRGRLFLFDVWCDSLKDVFIHGICRDSKTYPAQTFVGSVFRIHDSCGQVVASEGRTRKMEMTMQMADTKLTFYVTDFVKNGYSPRPDRCYISLYRYNSPTEVRGSFIPDADSTTLSLDVCREIFLHLPAKSLFRFRVVCKAWCAVIDEPYFVRVHTNKQLSSNTSNIIVLNSTGPPFHPLYSFDLDDLKFANGLQEIAVAPLKFTPSGLSLLQGFPVSTCNGLILVAGKSLEIWNPLTHDRLKLLRTKCNPNLENEAIGLGYDYTTDDYKVVVIHGHRLHRRRHGRDNFAFQTHVYSLRSDSWRNVENCPLSDDEISWWGPCGPGVFLCGALHWAVLNSPNGNDRIIVFDIGTESYRELQPPPLRRKDRLNVLTRYLNVLDGCLVVSDFGKADFIGDELEHYDVWVLKDYGDKDSWIKLISFENRECEDYSIQYNSRPVAYMKDKNQILLQADHLGWKRGYPDSCRFYMFDVESNSMKRVSIHGLTGFLYTVFVPGTIFRLHDNCGVNGSVTTRRSRRLGKRPSNMKMSDTKLNFCVTDREHYHWCRSNDSCTPSSEE